jgi:hypothetical protein
MAVAAPVADPSAALKMPAPQSIADKVKAQLAGDYPPGALDWCSDLAWQGPVRVPLAQVDRTAGKADWDAAAADKAKIQGMAKRIRAGWAKPVVLVRAKGAARLFAVDGHSRLLACGSIGQPVTAWIGTAQTATGGWQSAHARQLAGGGEAIELSAQTARLASTPSPAGKPGGPGLWRVRGMSLPPYFQNVRNALIRDGHSPADAYRLTWGAIRRWARGGGKVHPEVVAAAQAALADLAAKSARAHAHANDSPALEMAGMFSEQLHPRVPAGHQGGGRFGSSNTPLTAQAASGAPTGRLAQQGPEPPAELQRIRQLRFQAAADRHLARQILVKAQGLVRIRDGYTAGLLSASGTAKTTPVSAKRSAAAKKAAKTRKASGKKTVRKKSVSAAATKAANVARLNGQIRLLRGDARALIRSANRLDQMANGL